MKRANLCAMASAVALSMLLPLPALAQVTLDFPTWQAEEPGFGEFYKSAIAAFTEKNPDVTINLQQIPYNDYVNQLTVRFASGRPPQILVLPSDSFGIFAEQGWLAPLDERIAGTPVETEWTSLQSEMEWNGQTQGVLLMGYGFMLFYNQAILDEAGVEVPTSFEEFRTAVAATTDRDAGIFGLAAVTTEHPTIALDFIRFIEWQGQDFIKDGNYNLLDPGVVTAIENYRQTVGENSPLGNNSTIARQLFTEGRTAFLIDGPWMYTTMDTATPEVRPDLHMIPAPFDPVLGGASNSIQIPAGLDPEVEEKVWDFIEFIAQPEWQETFTKLTSSPSGREGVLTAEAIVEAPQLEAISQAVQGAGPIVPAVKNIRANAAEFSAIIRRAALRVLSTEEPVTGILEEAQQELERSIPLAE